MASDEFYIDSRNGNDSNDGLAWDTSLKTLGGLTAAQTADGDFGSAGDMCTIHCDGIFTEKYTMPNGRYNSYEADDFAILDGQGSIDFGWYDTSPLAHRVTGFEFRNYTRNSVFIGHYGLAIDPANLTKMKDCIFDGVDPTNGMNNYNQPTTPGYNGVVYQSGYNACVHYDGCVFKNAAVGFQSGTNMSYTHPTKVWNCTFEGNTIGIDSSTTTVTYPAGYDVKNCIFRNNTTHLNLVGNTDTIGYTGANRAEGGTWRLNYNCIDFSSGNCKEYVKNTAITTYTSLANWQALDTGPSGVGPDVNSISKDPLFVDEDTGLYGLTVVSPCLVNGSIAVGSLIQGAYYQYPMDGVSANANASTWTGATKTDTEIVSDNYVLTSGSADGTVLFDFNFGAQRAIHKFWLLYKYGWDTSIIAYELAMTDDHQTWKIRYRTSSVHPASWSGYTEIAYNTGGLDLNLTSVWHLGIELTLRNDA